MRLSRNLRLIASAAIAIGCGHDTTEVCPVIGYACVAQAAVVVQVKSAAGPVAVDSISMQLTGGRGGVVPCSGSVCTAYGGAGDYQITISAPGYAPAHLDVAVQYASPQPKCGCAKIQTEQRTVTLVPLAAA